MGLTCILVDDEPHALTSLTDELNAFKDRIQILKQFSNPKNAQQYLSSNTIDVVFLDIDMSGINGFEFLDIFPQRTFAVVFTTAYSHHAIDAFKREAIGYLIKPIDSGELANVIERLERNIEGSLVSKRLEAALDRINSMGVGPKKVRFNVDRKIVFVYPNEILYCESDGNYCTIVLEHEKKLFLTQKLKQVSDNLPSDIFYRVHHSYLINLHRVKEFHKNLGYVLLDNDKKIPVSRQKRNDVLNLL